MAKIKEIAKKKTDGSYERVPLGATKTSELNNDNGFITADNEIFNEYPKYEELAKVAISNQYKDLDGKPAAYTLPIATESSLGGIMVGPVGLEIDSNGFLDTKIATNTNLGVVQVDGTTIKVNEVGVISASQTEHSPTPGTTTQIGAVKPDGATLTIDVDGTMSAITATESTAGIVKPDGTSITIDADGTISAQIVDLGSPDTGLKILRGTYSGTQSSRSKKVHIDIGIAPVYVVVHGPSAHSAGWVTGIAEIMSDHMMANINWDIESDYSMTDVTRFDSTYLDESGFYVREFQLSGNTYDYVAFYY